MFFIPSEARPNSVVLRRKIAENYLAEIFYFRELQKYKAKITPDFIAIFNPAEQAFLRNMLQVLEKHLAIHGAYVEQLLSLLDYPNIDALVIELTAIDEVKEAIEKGIFKEDDDLFSKLVKIAGLKKEPIAKHLAEILKGDVPVDASLSPQVNEEVVVYLKSVEKYAKGASESMVRLFAYARVFDNMSLHYSMSILPEDAERKRQCEQGQGSHASNDLSNTIKDMILNRRLLPFGEMAGMIDEEWMHPNGEKISNIVHSFRTEVAKNAAQLEEIMGDIYATNRVLRAPRVGEERPAQIDTDIELEYGGARAPVKTSNTHLLRKPKLQRAQSAPQLVSAQSELRSGRTSPLKRLSGKIISKTAEIVATRFKSQFSNRNKGRFSGPPADLYGQVSFFKFIENLQNQVNIFAHLAADPKHKDDIRLPGWKFSVAESLPAPSLATDINVTTVEQKNDPHKTPNKAFRGELSQHGTMVAVATGQKLEDQSLLFTGVEFYGKPKDYQIDFVVRAMVESLAQIGQKKVCISISPDSPDAEALALHYAGAILECGGIPLLLGKNGLELTPEETKSELRAMIANKTQLEEKYRILIERYEAEVERVDNAHSEDKQFLVAFESFMGKLALTANSKMPDPRDPNKKLSKEQIVFKLAEIALVNHNMTTEQFVDAIVTYMARISLSPFASRADVRSRLTERLITLLAANGNTFSPQTLAAYVSREAAKAFYSEGHISISGRADSLLAQQEKQKNQNDLFLIEFNKLLQDLQFSSDNGAQSVTMDVRGFLSVTADKAVWSEARILEELAKIAFIDKQIDKDVFVDKIIDLAWASFKHVSGTVLSQPSRARLKNILLGRIGIFFEANKGRKVESEAELANGLIDLARGELESGNLSVVQEDTSQLEPAEQLPKDADDTELTLADASLPEKEQVVQILEVLEPKEQVLEDRETRKDEVLENKEDPLALNKQRATDMALNRENALLQEIEKLKAQIAQLQKMQAQKDHSETSEKGFELSALGAVLGENVHSSSIPQPPPPPPNLSALLKPNNDKPKTAIPTANNNAEPVMDLLTELKKGVVLNPVSESTSADRQLPPQKPSFEKELFAKIQKGTSGLHRASE